MKKSTVTVNDIQIYYELCGNGPVLTLIGGLGTATWLFERNVETLSKHFTVLTFDNRGAGHSSMPEPPYSISQMAQDLFALLSHLNFTKTHLLGVSMGGYIAQEFTLSYPNLIDKLVLVATTAGNSVATPMTADVFELLITPSEGDYEMMRKKFELAFTNTYLKEHLQHLINQRLATPQPKYAYSAQANAGGTFDRSADLHRITQQTLLVGATGDKVIVPVNINTLCELIPNTQTIVYKGFAHQFIVENANQFNHDVIHFLNNS